MKIDQSREGSSLGLKLEGRLDTITAPELEAVLSDSLGSVDSLTMDFSALEYLSSAGLRVLLGAQKQMNRQQGEMVIKNVNTTIMEVFEITGFSDILTIE